MKHLRYVAAVCIIIVASGLAGSTAALAADWLNDDWTHRVLLTVKPEKITGVSTLTDVTLLLHAESDSLDALFSQAKPDGSDLVFTGGDGTTVLGHEMVSYDAAGREAELWFRADTISSTSVNEFYLYYGNADTTITPDPGTAWSPDYLAIYHFEQDPTSGPLPDYGPGDGANPAIVDVNSTFSSDDLVDGVIGDAWAFDGITDNIYAASITSAGNSFTISSWFTNSDLTDGGMVAFQSLAGFWDISFRATAGVPNTDMRTNTGSMSWFPDIVDAAPHHYVWTVDADADTSFFYLDGNRQGVRGAVAFPGGSGHPYDSEPIAGRVGIAGPAFFNTLDLTAGVVDEYRIAETVRSPDQILIEFLNQEDAVNFFTYRTQQRVPVAVAPIGGSGRLGQITVWPNPFQGRAEVRVELDAPEVLVRVYDVAGRLVRSLAPISGGEGIHRLTWDGRDQAGSPVGSGIYYLRAFGPRSSLAAKVLLQR